MPVFPFFDNLFNWFEIHFGGVFSAMLFFLLLIYMQLALMAGLIKVGMRFITVIAIHPLEYKSLTRYNNTWMNAFFVNLIVFLCCSFSLTMFTCRNMLKYTSGTYISFLIKNVINVRTLSWAFKYKIFEIGILVKYDSIGNGWALLHCHLYL